MTVIVSHTSVIDVLNIGHGPWTVREIAETLRGALPAEHYFSAVKRCLNWLVETGKVEQFDHSGPNRAHCYALAERGET